MATERPHCGLPSCEVTTTGACAEGQNDFKQCPNFRGMVPLRTTTLEAAVAPRSADLIKLPAGLGYDPTTAAAVTATHPARVLFFLGDAGCGKTTLLASLYDQFQRGPYAGFSFAGCDTLQGFEKRCHTARFTSDELQSGTAEHTEHTPRQEGYRFLHLCLRSDTPGSPAQHVLFADVSGERMQLLRESTAETKKDQLLSRGDRIVLLLDGEKLLSPADRAAALSDWSETLEGLLAAGVLTHDSPVDVLLNKWDLLLNTKQARFAEQLEANFHKQLDPRVRLRFLRIAARPRTPVLPPLYNLQMLFPTWVLERHPRLRPAPVRWHEPEDLDRTDQRLRRQLPHLFTEGLP